MKNLGTFVFNEIDLRNTIVNEKMTFQLSTLMRYFKVSAQKKFNGMWIVKWQAEGSGLNETIELTAPLDPDSRPTFDGQGMTINGHPISISFGQS